MTRPSFQFYPGDWTRNANLRRCSPAARGVWLDVMCLMHDQDDEYGVLRWPLKEIAQAAGASMAHLRELVDKQVLKGLEKGQCEPFVYVPRSGRKAGPAVTLIVTQAGPIWYSSRMVRDEYVRILRAESGTLGATPKPSPLTAPKPPIGDGKDAKKDGGKGEPNGAAKGPRGSSSSSSTTCLNTSDPDGSGGEPPGRPPPEPPPQDPEMPPAPLPPGPPGDLFPPAPEPEPDGRVDAADLIFALGVPLLTKAGIVEKQARTFLGLQRKLRKDEEVADAIRRAIDTRALQPLEFIVGHLGTGKVAGGGSHTGFETRNYREGERPDGHF